jgi:transaldolase
VKIFADGANVEDFRRLGQLPFIKGFTTNPTLMKCAGVSCYETFIKDVLPVSGGKPVSFEVISDDFEEMKTQAVKLSKFGDNVYVKIPITNTKRESSIPLIKELVILGVKVNVTAVLNLKWVEELTKVFLKDTSAVVSIFAGRLADAGIDPIPVMKRAKEILKDFPKVELLWASPRELYNIFQAEESNCDIITVLPNLLSKIHLIGYDVDEFSLDTVKMFYNDAVDSKLRL